VGVSQSLTIISPPSLTLYAASDAAAKGAAKSFMLQPMLRGKYLIHIYFLNTDVARA
jgi:hypothetical protein